MKQRLVVLCAVFVAALGLAAGGFAVAQDASTPTTGSDGAPDTALCATPLAQADGTPVVISTAAETAASPGAVDPGTPVGLFPCATPIDPSPVVETGADATGGEAAASAVTVEMADIRFEQTAITIPANTDVTFTFVNQGVAEHNFVIDDPQVFSGDLAAGATSEVVVNLPAGTYQYYCSIPGHKDIGMVGTLTVQ